jgi:hypothetical protein
MRIAVKYCGNCNPEINSPRIIDRWMRTLKDDEVLFQLEGEEPADLLIIMCGCKKACVDRPEIRAMGKRIILIRGRWIEGLRFAEDTLGNELLRRVASMRETLRGNSNDKWQ